jgi:cytochrome c oxidase subunit II
MRRLIYAPCLLTVLLGGCTRGPSALAPKGIAAERIADLFWLFTIVSTIVWVLVVVGLAIALLRRRSPAERAGPLDQMEERRERITRRVVEVLVAVTAVILVVLTAASYFTGKSLANLIQEEPLTIQVTGWQWWWDVTYENAEASRVLTTANEIHIPANKAVMLKLAAGDVIHSFWVPELAGKEDLIPGRENYLRIVATKPGVYRGQCAEFCGLQHAHMGLRVIVDPPDQFTAWYDAQLKPANQPATEEARRGRDAFLSRPCVMCHAVRGTTAASRAGPDLTHVASRLYLAAETLPNTRGSLGAWIADPQGVKPGAKMPLTDLSADELNAIIAYLEVLR